MWIPNHGWKVQLILEHHEFELHGALTDFKPVLFKNQLHIIKKT